MKRKFTRILGVALPVVMVLALAVVLLPASTPETAEAAVGNLRFSNIPLPKFGSDGSYVLTPDTDVGEIAVAPTGNAVFATVERSWEGAIIVVASANISGGDMTADITYVNSSYAQVTIPITIPEDTLEGYYAPPTFLDAVDIIGVEGTGDVAAEGMFYLLGMSTETFLGYYSDTSETAQGSFGDGEEIPFFTVMKSSDAGYTWGTTGFFDGVVDETDPSPIVAIAVSPEYSNDTTLYVATEKLVYQSIDGGTDFTAMNSGWTDAETITDMDISLDIGDRLSIIVGTSAAAGMVAVELGSTAGDTAEWSTTEQKSGVGSVKLTHTASASEHAWIQFTPPTGISLAEFVAAPTTYGFSYWRTEDKIGPLLEMRFTDGGDALAEITVNMALYDYVTDDDTGQWIVKTASSTEQCMYYGENSADVGLTGTGTLGNLSALITDIAAGTGGEDTAAEVGLWEMTRVRVDLGWSGDTQTAYIDDVICDSVTYDLEAGGGHTFLGDVYVYCPATTGMSWQKQFIGARNVLAAAFSPRFADDEGIFAVTGATTDTIIQSSFGNTRDGHGWGANIGDGRFLDTDANDIVATRARMAFPPEEFDVDSITDNIAFVGLYAGTPGTGDEVGDVYRVTFQTGIESTTVDLNVRGLISTVRTATNIWSIDVSGDAAAATIIVGTDFWSTGVANYYWTSYYSTNSGQTWFTAREKAPTGAAKGADAPGAGAQTQVVMSPDFASDGVAYAGTKGDETSAFSRTADGGRSWNQISLIDYSNTITGGDFYTVTDFDPNAMFGSTPTAYMVTQAGGGRGAVWKTTNGGGNWERIWSYANPLVTDVVNKTEIKGSTVFAEDYTNGKFWRSSDDGATFPRVITAKTGGLAIVAAADENTIWTATTGGAIWSTTRLGRPWVKPDESDVVGDFPMGKTSHGDVILVACYSGKVFISTDAGVTYTDTVGVTNLPAPAGYACFDADYDTNHFVYCDAYGGGIWRIELNEEDPDSTEWKQIDADSTGADTVASPVGFQLVGPTIYYWDYTPVDTDANTGGFWRCVNPSADIDGLYPPVFEKTQTGLMTGMDMAYAGYAVYPNTIFMKDENAAGVDTCYNQVYAFGDVLGGSVSLVSPDDGAADIGIRLDLTLLTQTAVINWEAMPLATSYTYQISSDEEFRSLDPSCLTNGDPKTTAGTQVSADGLMPGRTYYWRVRVQEPLISPWSEARSFTVAEYAPEVVVAPFDIITPERGATGVSIQPTFVWAEVEGATSYELVVAEDPTFAIIDWSRTSANTFYKAEEALAYNTTYAWKVRAAPDGPWATGVFTTEAAPVEAVEPTVIEPTEPVDITVQVPAAEPAIPTYLLWTIIGIGAVLFIALIVLIVRTRRVT